MTYTLTRGETYEIFCFMCQGAAKYKTYAALAYIYYRQPAIIWG